MYCPRDRKRLFYAHKTKDILGCSNGHKWKWKDSPLVELKEIEVNRDG